MDKEREAFEAWFESQFKSTKLHKFDDGVYWHERAQMSWSAWQAAKAQATPKNKQFNLDEFLSMEENLKHKGGVITADLDRFIAYAEMVLEKAKALKEPK